MIVNGIKRTCIFLGIGMSVTSYSGQVANTQKLQAFGLSVDTLKLNDTDQIAGNPFAWQIMKDFRDREAYISYYPNLRKLKLYDLTDNKTLATFSTVKMETAFGPFQSLYYHNKDSIFYLLENALFISDIYGEMRLLEKINDSAAINQKGYFIQDLFGGQLAFYKGKLILPVTYFGGGKREEHSVFAFYDLENKTFEPSGIMYPGNYRKNFYGYAEYIYCSLKENTMLFSFHCNDSLFAYNLDTHKMIITDSRSPDREEEFTVLPPKSIKNPRLLLEKLLTSPYYGEVCYGNNGYIYRIYNDAMVQKRPDGLFNTWSDKPKYLMVLDAPGNVVGNIPLEGYGFVLLLGQGRDGIYFTGRSSDKPDGQLNEQIYKVNIVKQ